MEKKGLQMKQLGLISKIYKQPMILNSIKAKGSINKWAKDLNRQFSEEDIQMTKRHMKGCSILLLEKCRLKLQWGVTSLWSEWPSSKKSAKSKCWRACGEKGTFLYCDGDVICYTHYGEQYRDYLKKLKIEPYDLEIPLLGIYPEKTVIQKDTCTSVFTAALFTVTRTWKQPTYSLTYEWIKNMWYFYTMEHSQS